MWFVYVLKSEKSGVRYIGMTEHVENRLIQHNSGKSRFTKGHMPWVLVYSEEVGSSVDARKREKYLKSGLGRQFLDAKVIRN